MKGFQNLAISATLVTSVSIFPSAAQAQTVLGGIDVDGYCKERYGVTAGAELVENTAWGWRCRIRTDLVTISMDNACRFQYNQGAYSKATNSGDPYSWVCLSN